MSDYKAIFSNESFYEEVYFGDSYSNKRIRVGTGLGCTIRLHKEWFSEQYWIDIIENNGKWSIRCSDNLYFFTGDVRKLTRVVIEGTEKINVRYAISNFDAFAIELTFDYRIAAKDLRRAIDIRNVDRVTFGTQSEKDIVLYSDYLNNESVVLRKISGTYVFRFYGSKWLFSINGNRASNGDEIRDHYFFSIADILFYYSDGILWAETGKKAVPQRLNFMDYSLPSTYPRFSRSTRERLVLCTKEIEILDPPEKPQEPRNNILMSLLPSLGMIATSAVMATMGR